MNRLTLSPLIRTILSWQEEARQIPLPPSSGCKPATGGLPGPAFFPEGLGLSESAIRSKASPTFMAIGHNFGCEDYRRALGQPGRGREDNIIGTWCSLDTLLEKAGADPDQCYRTNWFVGLRPGSDNDGAFLLADDEAYEASCADLLLKQIRALRPRSILLLGPIVTKRSSRISPSLDGWRFPKKKRPTFADIDGHGHTVRGARIAHSDVTSNIVSLLHPSKGWLNQPARQRRLGMADYELIREALK
jgi:uracil-DNA glycosylase